MPMTFFTFVKAKVVAPPVVQVVPREHVTMC